VLDWFAGTGSPRLGHDTGLPWNCLLWPGCALIFDWWAAWKAENPRAVPPAGAEWLDDPTGPKAPPAWLVEAARTTAARVRRRR